MPRALYKPLEGIWHSDEFAALYLAVRVYGDDYNVLKRHLLKRTAADIAGALKSQHFFDYCQHRKFTPQGEVFVTEPQEIDVDEEAEIALKNEMNAGSEDEEEGASEDSSSSTSSSSLSSSSSSDSSSSDSSTSSDDDDDDDHDDDSDDSEEDEAPVSSFVSSQFGFTCVACGSRSLTHVCAAAPPLLGEKKKKKKKKQVKKKPESKQMQLRGKPQKRLSPMRKSSPAITVTSETVLKVFLNGSFVLPQSSWEDERDEEPPSKRAKSPPWENDEVEQRKIQLTVTMAVSRARAMYAEGRRQAKSARKLARDVGQSGTTRDGQVAQHRESALIGVYSGQVNGEDQAHGAGVAVGPDGHTFAGQWKNGLPDGCGLYTFANGNTFAGSVVGGKLSGHGVLTFASGVVFYEGEWLDNDIQGCGNQYCTNGELMHSGNFSLNRAVDKR